MLRLIFPSSLIMTGIFSILIIAVTLRSKIARFHTGKYWIALNVVVPIWAFSWCAGGFIATLPSTRWFFLYLANLIAIGIPATYFCFVKSFVDDPSRLSQSHKWAIGLSSALFLASLCFPKLFVPGLQRIDSTHLPVAGPLMWIFALQFLGLTLAGAWALVAAALRQRGAQRNKTLYVLLGCVIGLCGGFTTFPPTLGIGKAYPYGIALTPVYSILITYAIVKHRLMDITVIIRKTMVYAGVMAILTTTYLAIVALFAKVFEGISGSQTVFPSVLAAALITVFFQPLRRRIQAFVDRKFFRSYVDREEKLYELSREVITHTTPEAMAQALMRVLQESLHPKVGVLYLKSREGGGFVPTGAWGSQAGDPMPDDNPLARYFTAHPQPFVQDVTDELGESRSTRLKNEREDAA